MDGRIDLQLGLHNNSSERKDRGQTKGEDSSTKRTWMARTAASGIALTVIALELQRRHRWPPSRARRARK